MPPRLQRFPCRGTPGRTIHSARSSVWASALAGALFAAFAPFAAQAQPVAGLGDDAIPIQKGGVRLTLGALWDQWDRLLLPGGAQSPLLAGLATPSLGVSQIPALANAEQNIRALSGLSEYSLSFGELEARGGVRRATTTFRADVGLTRRVSLGVRVPYVEVRHDAQLALNRSGIGANVGSNLVGEARLIANGQVSFQLDAARTRLLSEIDACGTDGTGAVCEAILADPAAAMALAERSNTFRAAWNQVYGNGDDARGAPVIPTIGSDAHVAIGTTLAGLRTDFERYFTTTIPTTAPVGPSTIYGTAGLQTIATDSAFGVNADTLARTFRAGMGDVDIEARVLLFDTWGADQVARLASTRSGARVLASAGWRFGTASSAQTNSPFALATGEGVNALLLRVTADAVWRRRAWISATLRTTTPMSDQAVLRLPGIGDAGLFLSGSPQLVSRALGQRMEFEVAPRVNLGEKLGVSATWMLRSTASDRYTPDDGAEITTVSGSAQYGAIGITYSTLAAFVRGKSKWPLEVMFSHEVSLSASGAAIPSLVRDRLELRVYPGFPRR